MAKIETFHDLIVWQKGMDLVELIYNATDRFPPKDLYGIGAQIRKAAVSIPSNVAEGFARRSRRTYRRHVAISLGSQAEVQTQLEICRRLSLLSEGTVRRLLALASEVGRLLNGLWRSLAVKTAAEAVCYSLLAAALYWGLGPGAWGLSDAIARLP
jgi:four helix bundle protein